MNTPPELSEERVTRLMQVVKFLLPGVASPTITERTIRAMMVKGGTDAQIQDSLAVAAVNTRVGLEDKARYAYGCLRNMMMEQDKAAIEA